MPVPVGPGNSSESGFLPSWLNRSVWDGVLISKIPVVIVGPNVYTSVALEVTLGPGF